MKRITLSSDISDTDKLLKETEEKIKEAYSQAEKEVEKKLNDHLKKFAKLDIQKQQELDKVYEMYEKRQVTYTEYLKKKKEYQQWRINQYMTGSRWEELKKTLSQDLANASLIAESAINGHIKEAYAMNFNRIIYQFETETFVDTFIPIYNQYAVEYIMRDNPSLLPQYKVDIADAVKWNKQKISSVITQGILQGESIDKISKRMRKVTNMDYASSVRNARTASGAAANKGKLESFKALSEKGFNIKKQWISTLDNRTRHEHRLLMGQTVDLGKPFKVNGYELEYPCDPTAIKKNPSSALGTEQAKDVIVAAPEMIYNCRCVIVGLLEGYEKTIEDFDYQTNPKLNGMTLEEWKEAKPVYKK